MLHLYVIGRSVQSSMLQGNCTLLKSCPRAIYIDCLMFALIRHSHWMLLRDTRTKYNYENVLFFICPRLISFIGSSFILLVTLVSRRVYQKQISWLFDFLCHQKQTWNVLFSSFLTWSQNNKKSDFVERKFGILEGVWFEIWVSICIFN